MTDILSNYQSATFYLKVTESRDNICLTAVKYYLPLGSKIAVAPHL